MVQTLFRTAQPSDLDPRLLRRSKAEMQAQIILGTETAATPHLLHLASAVRIHDNSRPNGRTVCFRSDQPNQQPRIRRWPLVTKQRRVIINVVNRDVDAAGIKNVPKSGASAATRLREGWTGLIGDVREPIAVQVAQQDQLAVGLRQLMVRSGSGRIDGTA